MGGTKKIMIKSLLIRRLSLRGFVIMHITIRIVAAKKIVVREKNFHYKNV